MSNVTKKIVQFPLNNNEITNITISKKKMKNLRLVVSRTGNIALSMPYSVSYSYAYDFLVRKRNWITTQLTKINSNLAKDSCNFINNGNIFIFGNSYTLIVEQSTKNKVIFDNGFKILTKDLNTDFIKAIFIKWCKKYFLNFFNNRLNYIYNQIFKDSNPPQIKIKSMKSMWGNCNFVKRIVTLNLYLAKTRLECIDYVITHELCHLIHHNHSKDFHNLMTHLMPDWKERKKMLKEYSLKF